MNETYKIAWMKNGLLSRDDAGPEIIERGQLYLEALLDDGDCLCVGDGWHHLRDCLAEFCLRRAAAHSRGGRGKSYVDLWIERYQAMMEINPNGGEGTPQ